ncbi:MAG: hypothetical protein M1816_001642 [Peltula sp. TS41687]|nr:MAG: hypothetical protein M1816_001642 [Peltula sp. TS41687]
MASVPLAPPESVPDVMQQSSLPQTIPSDVLTVQPTTFAGAYLPTLFKHIVSHDGPGLRPADLDRFTHVNCSYLSHESGTAPTLTQLKRHAQCLANLICALDVLDNEAGRDPFDYLDDLHMPYSNTDYSHRKPLTAVTNLITTHQDQARGPTKPCHRCPFTGDQPSENPAEYVEHVNDMFEVLENMYCDKGGILGLVPPENMPGRAEMEETIFGQWLLFTTRLVEELVSQKKEVARQQSILAGEATTPHQLSTKGRLVEGKPLLFPQDRYVLANVSEELYDLLDKRLGHNETTTRRGAAASSTRKASSKRRQAENQPHEPDPTSSSPLLQIAHVDVTSRIFRLEGYKTLFIVPAFEISPNTRLAREHETRPDMIIQSLPRPPSIPSPRPRDVVTRTAQDRIVNDLKKKIRELEVQLKEKQSDNDRLTRMLNRMGGPEPERKLNLQEDLAWTGGVGVSESKKDTDMVDPE